MNRLQQQCRSLTAYFLENIEDEHVKFSHNLDSSLQFVLSIFGINIFYSLKTMSFSKHSKFYDFQHFLILTFD